MNTEEPDRFLLKLTVCVISSVGPAAGSLPPEMSVEGSDGSLSPEMSVAGSDGVSVAGSDESVGDGVAESSVGVGSESSVGVGLPESSVGVGVSESSVGVGSESSVGVGLSESSVGDGVAESVGDAESELEDTVDDAEPVPDEVGALEVADTVVDAADDDATVEDAFDIIALAWAGEIVAVEVPFADPPDVPARTICPRTSCCESMNAIVGPATSCVVARSRTLLSKGWASDVIQITTGPLSPSGTTQLSKGSETENGNPPCIIWQNKPSVAPLRASALNVSDVPAATVPVLVTAKAGLALMPTSQPDMNPPAMESTSEGVKAISNAFGIAAVPPKMLRTD